MKNFIPNSGAAGASLAAVLVFGLVGCTGSQDDSKAAVPSMTDLSPDAYVALTGTSLPFDLSEALDRDLGMSSEDFLKAGLVAQKAGEVLAYLGEHTSVDTSTAYIQDGGLFVYADSADVRLAALLEEVGAQAADSNDGPRQPPQPSDDSFSPASVHTAASVVGGLPIVRSVDGAAQMLCSVGFSGYFGSSPTLLTSGVCGGTTDPLYLGTTTHPQGGLTVGSALGTPLTGAGLNEPEGIGLVPVGSANAAAPQVSTWGSDGNGSPSTSTFVKGRAAAVVGAPICKSSYQTGWRCGTVRALIAGNQGDTFTKFEQIVADLCAVKGEVGSAAISGTNAVGLLTASSWSENCDTADQFVPNPYTTFTALQSASGRPSVRTIAPTWSPAVSVSPASLASRPYSTIDRIRVKVQDNVGIPLTGSVKWTHDNGRVATYPATCLETGVCSAPAGSAGWSNVAFTITFPSGQSTVFTNRYYLKQEYVGS